MRINHLGAVFAVSHPWLTGSAGLFIASLAVPCPFAAGGKQAPFLFIKQKQYLVCIKYWHVSCFTDRVFKKLSRPHP
jgi:hypothetical protein